MLLGQGLAFEVPIILMMSGTFLLVARFIVWLLREYITVQNRWVEYALQITPGAIASIPIVVLISATVTNTGFHALITYFWVMFQAGSA
jgi:hypothetical protein